MPQIPMVGNAGPRGNLYFLKLFFQKCPTILDSKVLYTFVRRYCKLKGESTFDRKGEGGVKVVCMRSKTLHLALLSYLTGLLHQRPFWTIASTTVTGEELLLTICSSAN